MSQSVSPELLQHLSCPRDHLNLRDEGGELCCSEGHRYPVVHGVPVFILPEKDETIGIAADSYRAASSRTGGPLYLDTLGLSEAEKAGIVSRWDKGDKVDPAVSYLVGATSGFGYLSLRGTMQNYPVPNIPLPSGQGRLLLDAGCSWGRWTASAARKGWRAIGIDPSLGAIMAAKRAFEAEGLQFWFVCGDARFLPFKAGTFDRVFSYSVIQHFSEPDAERAIEEFGRVLKVGGEAKIQMAQKFGFRSVYHRTRADYMQSGPFRVRYWSTAQLKRIFERKIGKTRIEAEAYGGLGLLAEDFQMVNGKAKLLIAGSIMVRALSRIVKPLAWIADSAYVIARKH